MDKFEDNVLKTISKYNMIQKGDRVLVALSGGPDSVALLNALNSLSEVLGIEIQAAHVNHMIRGEEASRDEDYVRGLTEKLGIKLHILRKDVIAYSKEKGISDEMGGREVRYNFFDEVCKKEGLSRVAVAHNLNDQIETFFMRLFRGSGIYGLTGIEAVRDNVIRPIIEIERKDIEEYCKEKDLEAKIDSTNLSNIYSRNKIRLELLPYIEKKFNRDINDTILRTMDQFRSDSDYLEEEAKKLFDKHSYKSDNKVEMDKVIFTFNKSIASRVIRNAIRHLVIDMSGFENKHIEDIMALYQRESGRSIDLPKNLVCVNNYKDITISKKDNNKIGAKGEYKLSIGETRYIEDLDLTVTITEVDSINSIKFDNNPLIKYFQCDKINSVTLRYRKDGDSFVPYGMNGRKKLKDYFINQKIPREKRENTPLILFDNEIAWVVGYRTSNLFKITQKRNNIFKIKVGRGQEHE